jgi:hypothetical protein
MRWNACKTSPVTIMDNNKKNGEAGPPLPWNTQIRASETFAVCRVLVVPVPAVWPEAVGFGGGIEVTAEVCVGDLREAVPAGGGVNRRSLAAARAVIPVTDL